MENIPDTPEGIILESMLEGMNQYYSAELKQKVNRGLRESWEKGNATGGRGVFGYNVADKKYVINEYESNIVCEAFKLYSQGYKAVAIAEIFKRKGYRRKNGMYVGEKYLYNIFHDIRYTGIVEHQGVIYDKIFPRIISDELWQSVSAINDENKIAPSRKKEIFDYILSGKLICGECKHRMSGESSTSHTGAVYYYYLCLSHRKKRDRCNSPRLSKQYLEDIVINTTVKMLQSVTTIHKIAEEIFEVHKTMTADDTTIKLLERKRREASKSQNNMIRAIEQGIITEATKNRLTELETEVTQLDFERNKEKTRSYSYLTCEQIEMYLSKFVFENTDDIKVRKLIVNAFIREVILYNDEIVITYNFTENPEHQKLNKDHIEEVEKQIENSTPSAFSLSKGAFIFTQSPPRKDYWNTAVSKSGIRVVFTLPKEGTL